MYPRNQIWSLVTYSRLRSGDSNNYLILKRHFYSFVGCIRSCHAFRQHTLWQLDCFAFSAMDETTDQPAVELGERVELTQGIAEAE